MKKFFDMDNPVMRALAVAADLLVLNLLTLLCSLPIVTAGAAITALNDMTIHMVREEDTYLIKPYFRSFAANWKRATLFWLLLLVVAALIYYDYLAALTFAPPLRFAIAAIAVMVLAVALYAFALLSRYENSLLHTVKNAAMLAVGFFPRTLVVTAFPILFWMVAIHFIRYGAPVLFLFGLSLPAYVCALMLNGVFHQLEK